MTTMQKKILIILLVFGWTKPYSQTVAVSATKSNVLYQWLENPLQIVVENTSCKNIIVKAEKGQVTGSSCNYIYIVSNDTTRYDYIKVGIKTKGKIKWLSNDRYFVRKLPDPIVNISSSYFGKQKIPKNILLAAYGLRIPVSEGFCSSDNHKQQYLRSYEVKVMRKDSTLFSANVDGNIFPQKLIEFIETKSVNGDTVVFNNFIAVLYEKEIRHLSQSIELTLE